MRQFNPRLDRFSLIIEYRIRKIDPNKCIYIRDFLSAFELNATVHNANCPPKINELHLLYSELDRFTVATFSASHKIPQRSTYQFNSYQQMG